MAMIEGSRWRKVAVFYAPLFAFIFGLLFPFYWMLVTTFRPDGELYRPWNSANYSPFWTMQDRKSTRLNSSHIQKSRMPSSA